MGEVGDLVVADVGAGFAEGLVGGLGELHGEHPVLRSVGDGDAPAFGAGDSAVLDVLRVEDAGDCGHGGEGRVAREERREAVGGAVGEAGQEDVVAIDAEAFRGRTRPS